jgi:hypothetical protein
MRTRTEEPSLRNKRIPLRAVLLAFSMILAPGFHAAGAAADGSPRGASSPIATIADGSGGTGEKPRSAGFSASTSPTWYRFPRSICAVPS